MLSFYNLGVTVFASWELHFQTALLCAWTLLIQLTGLGVPEEHQQHFCLIFGTAYLGSLANMGTIITLVLGLFNRENIGGRRPALSTRRRPWSAHRPAHAARGRRPAGALLDEKLQSLLEAVIVEFEMEELAARWDDDVQTALQDAVLEWVQRVDAFELELHESGVSISLQTQDDYGYYQYGLDVFPGRADD